MAVEAVNNTTGDPEPQGAATGADAAQLAIPTAALETLALRFRPGGIFTLLFRTDGTIAWHDASASMFFQRFVLPMLQYRQDGDDALVSRLRTISAGSGVAVWDFPPGVTIAAFPCVEKRQLVGILAVAGKSMSFNLGEDVLRVCSRLGLDSTWLGQQADELPAYTDDAIQRQARLMLSMVRDQVRLASMEKELDSLSGQLSNTYEELSLIYQLSSGMKVNRSANDFFKQACLDVMEVVSVRGMGVVLRGDSFSQAQEPVLYGALSLPPGKVHRLADELMIVLEERKTPLLIHKLTKDKIFHWLGDYAEQLLAVPLMRQEQVLGCLFGIDKNSGEFDSVDTKLLNSIANESAIYLENSMLFEDVHGLMMGLLHSLTSAVDAKDAYTCGHSERVALLSRLLAKEGGYSDQLCERVYMAGLLHDVGKIGVPESVLQKSGKLTEEEFAQIKKHPEIGARILRDIKQVEDIIPGVLHHHERYDGRGYPAGLASENIPLFGRIICLADCFDAMTSSRTYRKALPLEVALSEIRNNAGTQFDPVLTEHFLRIGEQRLRDLLREHHEQSKKLIDLQQQLKMTMGEVA
jgi:HD-GYP domain-containing protein (c-di-GMP phosphodiesterase class II)